MSILERASSPAALKSMTRDELRALSDEMRAFLIDICSRTGGHLGAGLGVVELTVARHHVLDTPRDQLVWDVGHQGYPHKLLTGRAAAMETLRQEGGLSGFDLVLGNGSDELISLLEKELDAHAIIDRQPPQPGDVPQTFADIAKARALLGYNPQTQIEAGLHRFVEWFRGNLV